MKKFMALVLALVCGISAAGCGGQDPAGNEVPQAQPNAWGVTLEAEDVTNTGLKLVCRHSGGEDVFELQTGSYYVVEKSENSRWEAVEYLPQEYDVAWTKEAWIIPKEDANAWDVDWEWLYGALPAGTYRLGKEIMNFRGPGDFDIEMVYADFVIQ